LDAWLFIQIKTTLAGPKFSVGRGQYARVSDKTAKDLIGRGFAEPFDPSKDEEFLELAKTQIAVASMANTLGIARRLKMSERHVRNVIARLGVTPKFPYADLPMWDATAQRKIIVEAIRCAGEDPEMICEPADIDDGLDLPEPTAIEDAMPAADGSPIKIEFNDDPDCKAAYQHAMDLCGQRAEIEGEIAALQQKVVVSRPVVKAGKVIVGEVGTKAQGNLELLQRRLEAITAAIDLQMHVVQKLRYLAKDRIRQAWAKYQRQLIRDAYQKFAALAGASAKLFELKQAFAQAGIEYDCEPLQDINVGWHIANHRADSGSAFDIFRRECLSRGLITKQEAGSMEAESERAANARLMRERAMQPA
jgi:hypothetical protein